MPDYYGAGGGGRPTSSKRENVVCPPIHIHKHKVVAQNSTAGSALAQIKARGYAEKYLAQAEAVYLIGVEFNHEERNISGFEWEAVPGHINE